MELKNFIEETLGHITEGIIEAQRKLEGKGCYINPEGFQMGNKQIKHGFDGEYLSVHNVKMSVSITVIENSDSKQGIGVVTHFLKAGTSKSKGNENNTTSQIEFEVPVSFPSMKVSSKKK